MADYLSTKDWQDVLDLPDHKKVKKTGISEILRDYASASKKTELGKMISALERLITKAGEVKTTQSAYPKLVDYLTGMEKAAKTKLQIHSRAFEKTSDDKAEENEATSLGKSLVKVKALKSDKAWHFVIAPGKPSTGFVLSKRAIRKDDIEQAFSMKGKRGAWFTGTAYGENGAIVLDLGPEVAPIPGLAKSAKAAALMHAEMNAKFIVRGMGKTMDSDTDSDTDSDLADKDEGDILDTDNRAEILKERLEKVKNAVIAFRKSRDVGKEGASDGLRGAIRLVYEQVKTETVEPLLSIKTQLEGLLLVLDTPLVEPRQEQPEPERPEPLTYLNLQDWTTLARGAMLFDPEKRKEAMTRYRQRLSEEVERLKTDQGLQGEARNGQTTVLKVAAQLLQEAETLTKDPIEDSPQLRRFNQLDRRANRLLKGGSIGEEDRGKLDRVMGLLRDGLYRKTLQPDDKRFDAVETLLRDLGRIGARESQLKGQTAMHEALSFAMPFLRNAAAPSGMIKNPELMGKLAKSDPELRKLLGTMSTAVKTPGRESALEMEKAARPLVERLEKLRQLRARAENPEDQKMTPEELELQSMAVAALQKAQLMRMVIDYDSLGSPPWDQNKADLASELQSQLFFIEGTIANGGKSALAPKVGSEDGAGSSGSWWIERTEANPGRNQPVNRKRQYIFKPGSTESPVFPGLPPGSSAPREVLAKRLDEIFASVGLETGVSPTTLASIDPSALTDINKRYKFDKRPSVSGSQLGSMQQLAPSDGSLGSRMNRQTGEFDQELLRSLDKDEVDRVAVFDMIFANLDRHGGNLLLSKDPESGITHLVPIDHGSGLTDPELLQANRLSLTGEINVLGGMNLPQSQVPLGQQALDALNDLDPDEMVAQMKQSRTEMARRHPQTDGTVSDRAIEAMGQRLRFMKLAAPGTPLPELMGMLSVGALRIADARPEDLPQLVEVLRAEARLSLAAGRTRDEIATACEGTKVQFDAEMLKQLQDLGWGWSIDKSQVKVWVTHEPELVTRILAAQMVNPDAERQMQDLLEQVRPSVPDVDQTIATMIYPDKLKTLCLLRSKLGLDLPKDNMSEKELRKRFDQLGGLPEIKVGAKLFPFSFAHLVEEHDEEDMKMTHLKDRVGKLVLWKKFNEEGGLKALLELGGQIEREMELEDALAALTERRLTQGALAGVREMSEEAVAEQVLEKYQRLSLEADRLRETLRKPAHLQSLEGLRELVLRNWENDKKVGAMVLLQRLVRDGQSNLRGEETLIQAARELQDRIGEFLRTEEAQNNPVQTRGLQTLSDRIDELCRTAEMDLNQLKAELEMRIDIVRNGAESKTGQQLAALGDQIQRLEAHRGLPWHGILVARAEELRRGVEEVRFTNPAAQVTMFGEVISTADALRDGLAEVNLQALPQSALERIGVWTGQIPGGGGADNGEAIARDVRNLLRQPVN